MLMLRGLKVEDASRREVKIALAKRISPLKNSPSRDREIDTLPYMCSSLHQPFRLECLHRAQVPGSADIMAVRPVHEYRHGFLCARIVTV